MNEMQAAVVTKHAYGSTPRLLLVGILEGEHDLSAGGDADIPGDRLALVVTKVDAK